MSVGSFVKRVAGFGASVQGGLLDELTTSKQEIRDDLKLQVKNAGDKAFLAVVEEALKEQHPSYPNNVQHRMGDAADDQELAKKTNITNVRIEGDNAIFTLTASEDARGSSARFFNRLGFDYFIEDRSVAEASNRIEAPEFAYLTRSTVHRKIEENEFKDFDIAVDKDSLAEKLGVKDKAEAAEIQANVEKAEELKFKQPHSWQNKFTKPKDRAKANQVVEAGEAAVMALITKEIKTSHPFFPRADYEISDDDNITKDGRATWVLDSFIYEGKNIVFQIKCPTDNETTRQRLPSIDKLMGELGFKDYSGPEFIDGDIAHDSYAHVGAGSFTPKAMIEDQGSCLIAVDKEAMLDKLGITQEAALAKQEARADKAAELGVKSPD